MSFEGKYYRVHDAEITPKPFQKPTPPIWIGGDSKRSMQLAAELGDGWLVHGHQPRDIDKMFQNVRSNPCRGRGAPVCGKEPIVEVFEQLPLGACVGGFVS